MNEAMKIDRMVDLTTLDTKIAGTTKSLHCFPPKKVKIQNDRRETHICL